MSERFPNTTEDNTVTAATGLDHVEMPPPDREKIVVNFDGEQFYDVADAMEKYRKEQVAGWRNALKGDISPQELERVTSEIESAIRREVSLIDDPNSPSRLFGDRIFSNGDKARHSASTEQGRGNNTSSQRYSAEMTTDILRGKFDVSRADEIVLNNKRICGVENGQHRVAALAMIFGPNDWQEAAKAMGHKIVIDNR